MMKKDSPAEKIHLQIKPVLIAGLVGILATIVLIFLCAVIIDNNLISQRGGELITKICLFTGAILAGKITSKTNSQRMIHALLCAAVISVSMFICSLLFEHSRIFNPDLIISILIIMSGCIIGCAFLPGHRKNKRRK